MRHRRALRVASAILVGALAVALPALAPAALAAQPAVAPAFVAAAPTLGTLTLKPDHGSVADTPMLSATTPAPCPSGYGTDATLRLGRGDAFNNLNKPQTAGDYDAAPFTIAANRSMVTSALATPADGDYQVIVICSGEVLGDNPAVFLATIRVHGSQWTLATVGPTAAATTGAGGAAAGADPAPVAAASASNLADLSQGGSTGHAGLIWVPIGLALLCALVFVVLAVVRRPVAASAPPNRKAGGRR